jgi:hypothetical protein|tara:strand:+ start:114 stop:590 length:477 start_codon:yes stop_codon:yes gene_type:complete
MSTLRSTLQELNSVRPSSLPNGVATKDEAFHHRHCLAKVKSGKLCRNLKGQGSRFCYFHDPELSHEREQKQKEREGLALRERMLPSETEAPLIESPDDVRLFAIQTAHQVATGELGAKEGQVISGLLGHIIRTLPQDNIGDQDPADKLRELLMQDEEE